MKIFIISLIFLINFNFLFAAGSDDESEKKEKNIDSNYINAKKALENDDYKLAIKYLLLTVKRDDSNADAYNLLGFSHRKLDLNDDAKSYYSIALNLDPNHKGAHEYIGDLYLKLNNLEKAKFHLNKLDKICFFGCDEYYELEKAIKTYEDKL